MSVATLDETFIEKNPEELFEELKKTGHTFKEVDQIPYLRVSANGDLFNSEGTHSNLSQAPNGVDTMPEPRTASASNRIIKKQRLS